MALVFQTHLDKVRGAVDATFGVAVNVKPLRVGDRYGNGAPAPDPERPPFTITGKFKFGVGDQQNLAAANTNQWLARMGSSSASLHVDPDRFPMARTIVDGDRLNAPDLSKAFVVTRVDSLSVTRLVFALTQVPV